MGNITGFKEFGRKKINERSLSDRIKDFNEFRIELPEPERKEQAARCMDCSIPFCQSAYGCPVYNLIPEWNDLVYNEKWEDAWKHLMKTNNFPEYTGRVCPAPCETACVLGINQPAVTIKDIECKIIDKAYELGYMKPRIPINRTGKKIAIIGSGPAGLSAADQLNQVGHLVTVFEKEDRIGGLLMYGIPNMKLEKTIVERRNNIMIEEGIIFKTNAHVGVNIKIDDLQKEFDSILLAIGSTKPRDVNVPGRNLKNIYFAMDYLTIATKALLNNTTEEISAKNKNIIVIGGGYTGSDCIGTAVRQECKSIVNFDWNIKPNVIRTEESPWPMNPPNLKFIEQDYGHKESQEKFGSDPRVFSTLTKEFIGNEKGEVNAVKTVQIKWVREPEKKISYEEMPGTEKIWDADIVLLSMGFTGPNPELLNQLGIEKDNKNNIKAEYGKFMTTKEGIFSAGDARRGASQVVWAINEGRAAAREIDKYLMGTTNLK